MRITKLSDKTFHGSALTHRDGKHCLPTVPPLPQAGEGCFPVDSSPLPAGRGFYERGCQEKYFSLDSAAAFLSASSPCEA